MIQNLISGSEWKACQMLVGVWLLVSWKMMRMMVLGQVIKKTIFPQISAHALIGPSPD